MTEMGGRDRKIIECKKRMQSVSVVKGCVKECVRECVRECERVPFLKGPDKRREEGG